MRVPLQLSERKPYVGPKLENKMTKTALLFAGQGAQTVGMGRDLYDRFPLVRNTYDQASRVLGYDLRQLIDEEEGKLHQTRYTQPALLTTSMAIYRLLEAEGLVADQMAGLSLGEYTALVAAGALDFEQAVALVAKRGEWMETAAPPGSGKMVAVLNTDAAVIEAVCAEVRTGFVAPANYNTPAQIVIGGEVAAVDEAIAALKEKGVKRLIPLNVSGPFHTALLRPASEQLATALKDVTIAPPRVPVIGNTEAEEMKYQDISSLLARQVMEPVRFYESIATMQEAGVNRFIEIGPGKVLSGFIKKIDKSLESQSVEDCASLETFLARL